LYISLLRFLQQWRHRDGLRQPSYPACLRGGFLPYSRELILLECYIPVYTQKYLTDFETQIGTPTASVSNEVAAVQRLMKASGLEYSMHSAGTTVGT
jgi:hypothetical protein